MSDIYQGDPALFLGSNGAYMKFKGGQPIMDGGLENAVKISLFTNKGWVGNILFTDPNKHVGSDFLKTTSKSLTLQTLIDIENAALKSLQWMLDSGIVSEISVDIQNPTGNILNVTILIKPTGSDIQTFLVQKNSENWVIQKLNPAHGRI